MTINKDRAHEVDHGLVVNDPNSGTPIEGPFYTGGPSSPVGLSLPVNTFYVQNLGSEVLIWKKFGVGVNDWRQYSAQDIPFDPSNALGFSDTNLQDLGESLSNFPFGKDFTSAIVSGTQNVSGAAFVPYQTLPFNVTEPSGTNKYRVAFDYHWGHNSAFNDIRVQYVLDAVTVLDEMRSEPKDPGTDQRKPGSYVTYLENLSSGLHSLILQFRPATASRQSRMYRSAIEVWRVE